MLQGHFKNFVYKIYSDYTLILVELRKGQPQVLQIFVFFQNVHKNCLVDEFSRNFCSKKFFDISYRLKVILLSKKGKGLWPRGYILNGERYRKTFLTKVVAMNTGYTNIMKFVTIDSQFCSQLLHIPNYDPNSIQDQISLYFPSIRSFSSGILSRTSSTLFLLSSCWPSKWWHFALYSQAFNELSFNLKATSQSFMAFSGNPKDMYVKARFVYSTQLSFRKSIA